MRRARSTGGRIEAASGAGVGRWWMGEDLGRWYVDGGRMIRWEPIPRRLTRRERLVTALQRMWQRVVAWLR